MNDFTRFLKSKGKLHDNSNFYSQASLEEIEKSESAQIKIWYCQLDGMAKRGEISLDKPPKGFGIYFDRWAIKEYGVTAYVEYLKKSGINDIAGRLRILGVTEKEIKAALNTAKGRELKSKAMTLGNRLSVKGQNRSAAFVQAWQIVKAGGLTLPVKGVSFGTRQEALKRLAAYDPAQVRTFIVPEPENQVDPAAVAVMVGIQNGRGFYRLGYVPRGQAAAARALCCQASIQVLTGDIYGARITLAA